MDEGVTEAKLLRGLGLATLVITVVAMLGLGLPALVVNALVYRSLVLEVVSFLILTAVVVMAGLLIWRERPFGRWRWVLLVAVCVAAVVALAGIPHTHLVEGAEWSFGVVCWIGLLLLLDYGFVAVVVFLTAHLAARLGLLAAVGEADRASVVGALIFTAIFLAYQFGVAFAAVLLRCIATSVVDLVREEERLRTAEAVAGQLHRDRQERYAGLNTVPLLTGLAAGALDPGDDRVRNLCAVEAARMRRLFAESDDVADPLMHELRACVDTAERKGVTVYLGMCGGRPDPPLRVRRALTEPALTLLATAVSQARVTVIGSPTTVTVSVVTDGDPPSTTSTTDDVTVTHLVHGGRHWMEATWHAMT